MATKTSTPKRTAAYVELEHRLGIATLHCPVCGDSIIDSDEGLLEELCSHVLLVQDWADEIYTRDDDVEALVDAAANEAEPSDKSLMERLRPRFGQNVVFFESFQPATGTQEASAITVAIDMVSPPAREGPISAGVTGTQGPTRWRGRTRAPAPRRVAAREGGFPLRGSFRMFCSSR